MTDRLPRPEQHVSPETMERFIGSEPDAEPPEFAAFVGAAAGTAFAVLIALAAWVVL